MLFILLKKKKDSNREMTKSSVTVAVFTIGLIFGALAVFLGFLAPNMNVQHRYPRINRPGGGDVESFVSTRYSPGWFYVYSLTFSILPCLLLAISLFGEGYYLVTFLYRVVTFLVIVVNIILLVLFLIIWIFGCSTAISGTSLCSDRKWCCVHWASSQGSSLCTNGGNCLKASGALGIYEFSDLSADPIWLWHVFTHALVTFLLILQVSAVLRVLEYEDVWNKEE